MAEKLFAVINALLIEKGLLLRQGTIVDATLIAATSSTKKESRERDLEMHQTKRGNQWYFSMKAHIGMDAVSGLNHPVVTTADEVHDVAQAYALLHVVFGYAGYQGAKKGKKTGTPLSTGMWP